MSWKSVNVKSTLKVITTAMIGVSSGSVTFQNCCQGVAPSIEDASYRDGGMVCSPASRDIATNGAPPQRAAPPVVRRGHREPGEPGLAQEIDVPVDQAHLRERPAHDRELGIVD